MNKDLDDIDLLLEDALTSAYWHGELGNKNGVLKEVKDKAKQEILSLVLKALPEKITAKNKLLTEVNCAGYNGYNQAISEAEANIRRVLG